MADSITLAPSPHPTSSSPPQGASGLRQLSRCVVTVNVDLGRRGRIDDAAAVLRDGKYEKDVLDMNTGKKLHRMYVRVRLE